MDLKKIIALGLAGIFLLTGCAERREVAQQMLENKKMENRHEATTFAMDTVMSFIVIDEDGDELIIDAEQEIRRLENLLSITLENSEISKLNAAAGKEPVELSNDTMILLEAGKNLGAGTGGAFNIAISPIVKAWGFTEEDHGIVHEAMHRLGVEDMRGRFLNQLSGGEKLCLDCYESYDRFDA